MIRSSFKLLKELSELENQINQLENYLSENCPDIDLEVILQQSVDKMKQESSNS